MPQLLFVGLTTLSLVALASAAARVASVITPLVWERLLIVPVLVAATMTAQALALGLVGWGTHPAALATSTAVIWAVARIALPAPDPGLLAIGLQRLRGMDARGRAIFGALSGAALLWCIWSLWQPYLGHDGLNYHLPEIVQWVHDGRPGSIHSYLPGVPTGEYPVTNEVLLSWLVGFSRSLLPLTLLSFAGFLLLCVSIWRLFRLLGAPAPIAGLGVAAATLVTPLVTGLNGPNNDAIAVAWLASCAALCLSASLNKPVLIAPAAVAAALAIGTKTTTLPLALFAVGFALVTNRRRLQTVWPALGVAAVVGVAAGGVWYIRNLVNHGSPLWPFVAAPWGTPEPPEFVRIGQSLLGTPWLLLSRMLRPLIVDTMAGGALLIVGVLVVFFAHNRRAFVLGIVAAGALLLWMNAPFTGIPENPVRLALVLGGTRYALPLFAAAAAAIAATAANPGPARWLAAIVFSLAALANLIRMQQIGSPFVPELHLLAAAALVGAGIAGVLAHRSLPDALGRAPRPALAVVAAAVFALAAVPAATGYTLRHGEAFREREPHISDLLRWLDTREDWKANNHVVWMTNYVLGSLTGDEAQHLTRLVPLAEPCHATFERRGWIVFSSVLARPPVPLGCQDRFRPAYANATYSVFSPDRSPESAKAAG